MELNKLVSATRYIANRLKELNHLVVGMLLLRDFFIVYSQFEVSMAGARNAINSLTVYMNKRKLLLGDLSTGRLTPNIISPNGLKIYLGWTIKYLLANGLIL